MRINQYIARSGLTSRRKAEGLITSGAVTINGIVVKDLAAQVDPKRDVVAVEGTPLLLPALKYYALNKPKGYTVTKEDPHAEKTVLELLPEDSSLFPIGRLDRETEGLILVTNDGDFAQNIIHPSKKIEKEYLAKLNAEPTEAELNKLIEGVNIDSGMVTAKKINKRDDQVLIVIEEGRNRQVRKMFSAIGYEVTELKRVRIGELVLDIPIGKWRELTTEEVSKYVNRG